MTKHMTLGDIARELEAMRACGVTHQSILYCVERVFADDIERERELVRAVTKEARND